MARWRSLAADLGGRLVTSSAAFLLAGVVDLAVLAAAEIRARWVRGRGRAGG